MEGVVTEQPARVAQLQRDDHGRIGQHVDSLAGGDLHAERAGVPLEAVDEPAPAADDEARRRPRRQQEPVGALPHEGRRQHAGVVVEGVDAGERGQQVGGAGIGMVGHPGAEIPVDGCDAPAQAQARRDQAQRRRALNGALGVKPHTGEQRPRHGRKEAALAEPVPENAAPVDRVRPEVRLVRTVGAARAPADGLVRLEQPHGRAAFGAGDRRGQARDAASDDRDLRHAATVRPHWPRVQFQLWLIGEGQLTSCWRSTAATT